MKCHHCQQELIATKPDAPYKVKLGFLTYGQWSLECPSKHCLVRLGETGQITNYIVHYYPAESKWAHDRYTIDQSISVRLYFSRLRKKRQLKRNRKHQWYRAGYFKDRDQLLILDHFIPLEINKDGVLMVEKLFHKLKTYMVFS